MTGLVVLLLTLGWFTWRYFHLRRSIEAFSQLLHRTTQEKLSVVELPRDVSGLEDLSNAVKALTLSLEAHSLDADAERNKLSAVLESMTDGVLIAD
ncbi:MAG: hypothetical protein ABIJ65_05690, partial [Chloroflexota bacterium]